MGLGLARRLQEQLRRIRDGSYKSQFFHCCALPVVDAVAGEGTLETLLHDWHVGMAAEKPCVLIHSARKCTFHMVNGKHPGVDRSFDLECTGTQQRDNFSFSAFMMLNIDQKK